MHKPIGIFDSGVGGLSVWYELQKNLPNENFIYLADSANCPYGEKSQQEILHLSKINTDFLMGKNCKLIVVACNTATAAAIDTLRQSYSIPFIGMEPAVKPAALKTKTGKIGILATEGTFNGRLFQNTKAKYAENIETIIQPGYGLVEIVEKNKINSSDADALVAKYIEPMLEKGVDKIVLGCTHYPFLKESIKKIAPGSIEIINPAPAIAKRTIELLDLYKLRNKQKKGTSTFYTNGDPKIIKNMVRNKIKIEPKVIVLTTPPYTN